MIAAGHPVAWSRDEVPPDALRHVGLVGSVRRIVVDDERIAPFATVSPAAPVDVSLADDRVSLIACCPDPIVLGCELGLPRLRFLDHAIDGGTEWITHRPPRRGEAVDLVASIDSVDARRASDGRLLLRTVVDVRVVGSDGELLGTVRGTSLDVERRDGFAHSSSVHSAPDRHLLRKTEEGQPALAVGTRLPTRTARPSVAEMEAWSAIAGDETAFHVDPAAAEKRGFDRPVVHGPWKTAVFQTMLADWLDGQGVVERLSCTYREPDLVDDPLAFDGEVVAVDTKGRDTVAECELRVIGASGRSSVVGQATLRMHPALPTDRLPLDEVRRAVRLGEVSGEFTYRVEANDVERFVEAVTGAPPTAPAEIAPPTFFATLDPVERRDLDLDAFLSDLPYPMVGGGNAFNEVDYERPIRVGDVITVRTTYTDVYEKPGSVGTLLFRVRENELRDQDGELVARTRCGHVLAYDLSSGGSS